MILMGRRLREPPLFSFGAEAVWKSYIRLEEHPDIYIQAIDAPYFLHNGTGIAFTDADSFTKELNMRIKSYLLAGAMALATMGMTTAAHADLVSIGMAQDASLSHVVTKAFGDGSALFNGPFGTFASNIITAQGTPPLTEPTLQTTSIDVKSTQSVRWPRKTGQAA